MHHAYFITFSAPIAIEEVLKEWQKATKHDAAVRVASALSSTGKEGVQATYERSPEFHEAWKEKSHLVLARSEWRRRKLTKRVCVYGGRKCVFIFGRSGDIDALL